MSRRVRQGDDAAEARGPAARAFAWLVAGPLAFIIIAAWILAAWAAVKYLPTLGATASSVGDIAPAGLPALQAERRSAVVFGSTVLSRTDVVQRDPAGLSQGVRQAAADQALAVAKGQTTARYPGLVAALPVLNDPRLVPKARESGTTIVTYLYFQPSVDYENQRLVAQAYARDLAGTPGASVVGVTGVIPAKLAQDEAIFAHLNLIEIATIAVIGLILALTFRSIGAPVVTLAAGLLSYTIAIRIVAWVGAKSGIEAPAELQPLMIVLLLGVVTDYAIFLLSGFRRQLAAGATRGRAVKAAVAENAPIIATAGVMVAAGTAVLVVAQLHFFRAFGPGMALTVLVGLAVALTLVPALLGVLGRLVFWPAGVDEPPGRALRAVSDEPAELRSTSLRARLLRGVTKRPAAFGVVALCLALLLFASLGLRHASLGFDLLTGLPRSSPAGRAADAAATGFASGILSPTEILLQQPGLAGQGVALGRLEGEIAAQPGVSAVFGPREQATGIAAAGAAGATSGSSGNSPSVAIAPNGAAARYLVVLTGDPLGSAGMGQFKQLEAAMPALERQSGLGGVATSYAGDTAVTAQTISATDSDLVRIAIAAVIVDLLLLIFFLRALVAPVYLLAASVLALTASAGITVVVFQRVFGVTDLTYYVPFAGAVLLVALGSDYNIFLMGQIWHQGRLRPVGEAIEVGVPRAAHAISIAAITLAASFALLALVPLTSFRQLAFLLAVGILIDSFIVRSLLVPAMVAFVGRSSAWPGRLRRRRPQPETPAEVEPRRAA